MDNQENNQPQPFNDDRTGFSSPPPSAPTSPSFEPSTVTPVTAPDALQPLPQNTSPNEPPAWFSEQTTVGNQPPVVLKPKKKALFGILIIAGVLAVLGGGSALAYNLWYQNPQKVVTDSIVNAIKAKSIKYTGSIVATGDQKVKIEITGRAADASNELDAEVTFTYNEKDVTLEGTVLTDTKGDLYFKVKNIDTIVSQYRDAQDNAKFKQLIDEVVDKINDQWIKVNADDLKSVSQSASKSQECFTEAVKKIQDDKATTSELADTYKKHTFIIIDDKLGSKDGSLGYELSIDKTIAKAFVAEVKNTQIYKALQSCDKDFKIDEEDIFKESEDSSKTQTKVQLWVSRFSHEVTKLSVEGTQDKDKTTILFQPVFNGKIDAISTPAKSTTIKQLQSDVESLFQAAMGLSQTNGSSLFDEDISSEL